MNIVFLGSPDFSCLVLESLINSKHNVVAVVTNEDKKVGRKQILTETPVKTLAKKNNIKVLQFHRIRKEGFEVLKTLNADIFITCAYGQIISEEILNIPKYKTINVHFSLLPKYRGACPVQSALLCGETKTGVTIMRSDVGIDTGDIILQKELEISSSDDASSLLHKLSEMSIDMLLNVLDSFENDTVKFIKQGEDFSYFPMIKKEDGLVDFNLSAKEVFNKIRAYKIWPTAYFNYNNKIVKVFESEVVDFCGGEKNGEVVLANKNGLIVRCGENSYLKILQLQQEGGKKLFYKDFLNGNKLETGTIFNGNTTEF